MPKKRKVLIVVNPKAGSSGYSKPLSYVESKLRGEGIESERFFTSLKGKGLLSAKLETGGFDEVLVLGGDGTLNYTVNEMRNNRLPLGIVGIGTGNDSVRSLHGVSNFKQQVDIAIHGQVKAFDLGSCNGRFFVNGLGLGFDGQVVSEMQGENKKSRWDYLKTVLRILYRYKEQEVFFFIDGEQIRKKVLLLTVSNGTTFGGGFVINPFAKADDGLLDLCILGEIPPLKRFWHLPKLSRGTHSKLKVAEFKKAKKVSIKNSSNLVAHLDGELFGHPPFEISIHPEAFLVRVPGPTSVRFKN